MPKHPLQFLEVPRRDPDKEIPMQVFRFSITYLMLLFAALLIDHYFIIRLVA